MSDLTFSPKFRAVMLLDEASRALPFHVKHRVRRENKRLCRTRLPNYHLQMFQ